MIETSEISKINNFSIKPLEKAISALGGKELLKIPFSYEADGVRSIYGESYQYRNDPQPVAEFHIKGSIENQNIRMDWNTVIFRKTPIKKNLQYSEIIKDKLGYVVGKDNWLVTPTTNIPSGRVASIRKQFFLCNPHLYLNSAIHDSSYTIKEYPEEVVENGTTFDILELTDGSNPAIKLFVDSLSGHIKKLETLENDHLYRDVSLVVTYDGWTTEGDGKLSLPQAILLKGRGEVWYEEHRTIVTQNVSFTDEFTFPPEVKPIFEEDQYAWGNSTSQFVQMWCTFGVSKNEQQLDVEPIELAKGVYFIKGAMYNCIVVDQGQTVAVIEAPLYPERSEAVIKWIESSLHKSISQLVVSHHHYDHTGGIRAYVARGIPVMVASPAIGLIEKVCMEPSTVVPDLQEHNHAKPNFLPIELHDIGVIDKGNANIKQGSSIKDLMDQVTERNIIYAFRFKTSHATDALLIVIKTPENEPTVFFQSDMFNPDDKTGRSLSPIWAVEFAKEVKKAGLNKPNTILCGGHAGHAPLNQLYNFVDTQIPFFIKGFVFFQAHKRLILGLVGLGLISVFVLALTLLI